MTTWEEAEGGIETSQPREGYEFIFPSVTYRFSSGSEDITINGNLFRRGQVERTSTPVTDASSAQKEMTIRIPMTNPVATRYLRGFIPPKFLRVYVYREQVLSGTAKCIWRGEVRAASFAGGENRALELVVPSRLAEAMQRRLPLAVVGPDCPHQLYDKQCNVLASAFRVPTTIANIQGAVVTVAGMAEHPDQWAQFGSIRHVATQEEITVFDQTGNDLTLQFKLYDASVGDAIEVFAGCSHDISTCATKFGNQGNFGGAPLMPFDNPFITSSKLGIISQT